MKKQSLFKYTWPIFIELILQFLVGNVDQIMCNQVSDSAVSAISNANQITFLLLITFTIISLAITILASQYYGSKQIDRVSKVYSMGIFINVVFAAIIMTGIFVFARDIFVLMNVPDICLDDSVNYLLVINIGMIIQALYTTYVAIFRTKAWMKQTMYISVIMNGLNIVGNFILIPHLSVVGAATSSVIAKFIGLSLLIIYFNRNATDTPIDFTTLKPFDFNLFKQIMSIGLPAGAENICYSASQLVILKFVNSFGNLIIKTRSFAAMFANLALMFGSAISQAVQIIVGYEIGKKNYDNANREVIRTAIYSAIIGSGISLVIFIFSDQFYGLFISDAEALKIAHQIMFIEIFLEAGRGVNMTMVRSLQAAGDTFAPAMIGMVSMWGVSVLLSYVLGIVFEMGLIGVWIAMCSDEVLRAFIFIFKWSRGKWKNYQVV